MGLTKQTQCAGSGDGAKACSALAIVRYVLGDPVERTVERTASSMAYETPLADRSMIIWAADMQVVSHKIP